MPQCQCKMEQDRKKPIYGKTELKNGLILPWLLFVESEEEALRLENAWWKGVIVRCWITPKLDNSLERA